MTLRSSLRAATLALLATCLLVAPAATQRPDDAAIRADLAAITLTAEELPAQFSLVGESFVAPDGGALDGEIPAELADAGLAGTYLSIYRADDGATISSYASAWADAASAAGGFELLESLDGEEDRPLDAGDGPAELSVTDDGFDATFVVDRFVVGVAVSGGAIGEDDLGTLVSSLEQRAAGVAAGELPVGTDATLPGRVLDLSPLGSELQSGFLAGREAEQLYGLTGSSLGQLEASWTTLVATGDDAAAPYAAISLSRFGDADTAARVVAQADELVPLTLNLQGVDGVAIDGADAVRAFQYTGVTSGGEPPDSARIVMQVGAEVIVIDVQAAGSADVALSAAESLAGAQLGCLDGTCELPELDLTGA